MTFNSHYSAVSGLCLLCCSPSAPNFHCSAVSEFVSLASNGELEYCDLLNIGVGRFFDWGTHSRTKGKCIRTVTMGVWGDVSLGKFVKLRCLKVTSEAVFEPKLP